MEGIHRVVIGLAIETRELLVIQIGNPIKMGISRQQVGRTSIAVPCTTRCNVQAKLLLGIVGHHTAVAWQHGMHAQLTLTGENLLLQRRLLLIPAVGQRATPPLQVVHCPPGEEGRTGDELSDSFLAVAQFQQHVAPYYLFSGSCQWHVDAMKRHPVYLFLPTLPVPESHGIGKGAIVEVVTIGQPRGVSLRFGNSRQMTGQAGVHVVPTDHDTGVMLQIPVDTRSNVDPRVTLHTDARTVLGEFKEIGC